MAAAHLPVPAAPTEAAHPGVLPPPPPPGPGGPGGITEKPCAIPGHPDYPCVPPDPVSRTPTIPTADRSSTATTRHTPTTPASRLSTATIRRIPVTPARCPHRGSSRRPPVSTRAPVAASPTSAATAACALRSRPSRASALRSAPPQPAGDGPLQGSRTHRLDRRSFLQRRTAAQARCGAAVRPPWQRRPRDGGCQPLYSRENHERAARAGARPGGPRLRQACQPPLVIRRFSEHRGAWPRGHAGGKFMPGAGQTRWS